MTTPPINNFQDILDTMERNPALRDQMRIHILTQELLQLPAQFLLLRTDVDETKTDMAQVIDRVGNVEVRMGRVEGRLGNIEGNLYEERAVNRIVARAARLGVETARIAFSKTGQARQDFHNAMTMAVSLGRITQDEYDDLTEADLIVRGRNRRHLVVEISMGPDVNDIRRSLRRAGTLQRATGETVTPVVAAPNPHPEFIQEAEASNVTVLDIPT